nr:uncharacterized protein LOC109426993 [Aedes albopictus]
MLLHSYTVVAICLCALATSVATQAENATAAVGPPTVREEEESLMKAIGLVVDKLKDFHSHLLTDLRSIGTQSEGTTDAESTTDGTTPKPEEKNLWKKLKQKVSEQWNALKNCWSTVRYTPPAHQNISSHAHTGTELSKPPPQLCVRTTKTSAGAIQLVSIVAVVVAVVLSEEGCAATAVVVCSFLRRSVSYRLSWGVLGLGFELCVNKCVRLEVVPWWFQSSKKSLEKYSNLLPFSRGGGLPTYIVPVFVSASESALLLYLFVNDEKKENMAPGVCVRKCQMLLLKQLDLPLSRGGLSPRAFAAAGFHQLVAVNQLQQSQPLLLKYAGAQQKRSGGLGIVVAKVSGVDRCAPTMNGCDCNSRGVFVI